MHSSYQAILDAIGQMDTIDTHEHLPGRESDATAGKTDILKEYLIHYFSVDLISSGLAREDMDKVVSIQYPLAERWKIVEPFWENARYTGYGRAIDETVRGLYGIDRLDGSTLHRANELFQQNRADHPYERVLKEKCRIKTSLVDNMDPDSDPWYFTPVYKLDPMICIRSLDQIQGLSQQADIPVTCFDDWLEVAGWLMDKAIRRGVTVFKSALAYERTLRYDQTDRTQAETAFNSIFAHIHEPEWVLGDFTVAKAFQDYMMHYLLRIVNRQGLTVQFHTGILEGNGNLLSNSNPALLNNLMLLYRNMKFDLFHISYPYQREAIALCKMFPNVFLDMCWAHIISPNSSVEFLSEALDAVAYNKISAFGGDYCMVDTVYGHLMMARKNVARALSRKVEECVFGEDRACRIAQMLFYDNPLGIFGLKF